MAATRRRCGSRAATTRSNSRRSVTAQACASERSSSKRSGDARPHPSRIFAISGKWRWGMARRSQEQLLEFAALDQGSDAVNIRGQRTVGLNLARYFADKLVGFLRFRTGAERSQKINALACTEKFDGQNIPQIVQHGPQAPRAAHSHRNVIFLISRRGGGVHGMRRCRSFVL